MTRTEISLIAVVLLAGGGAGAWYFADDVRRMIASSAFSPTMAEYLSLLERVDYAGYDKPEAVLAGKVVIVDVEDGGIDTIQDLLSDGIRAAAPTEVGMLAGVKCWERFEGTYMNGPPTKGYTHYCEIELIRLAGEVAIDNRQFWNGPPSTVTGAPQKVVGARPDNKIVDYLAALSRQ